MKVLVLAAVCGLIVGQDARSLETSGGGFDSANQARETEATMSVRRSSADVQAADKANLCFSAKDDEQIMCNDRRSKFNFNPFGLRFGKRYNSYVYRRAVTRATLDKFSPLSVFLRELKPDHFS
ncbi:kisspeptin 2 [Thalassophryne amazonica]|uniref:kisspeptin 2 n=1 Tax=Thalassophryne amazonica TaxID=390379 RepID=UPI0014721CC9|nr:kisspeptin 2 [Thalassophryne amazonica]